MKLSSWSEPSKLAVCKTQFTNSIVYFDEKRTCMQQNDYRGWKFELQQLID